MSSAIVLNILAFSVPAFSVPAFSVPALSVPALSVPALSVRALSVPALSVPAFSVPPLSVPAFSFSILIKSSFDDVRSSSAPVLFLVALFLRTVSHVRCPRVRVLVRIQAVLLV